MMAVEPITDAGGKSALCVEIARELPMWFGRPEANARYARDIASRDAFAALVDGKPLGLIALEYHFGLTCCIWWLGVRPSAHRQGLGRALVERAAQEARLRGCSRMAVETMSPRTNSREYDMTRRFYAAVGFVPFVEFEPEPGDSMMWMLRTL
jgi:GNAT superfamily N-acetyltransferase